ncbi:MAG: N-acetylmuramoyl-L-alanine amidase-like domain-containing protein [Saprospiraceae bacterium]
MMKPFQHTLLLKMLWIHLFISCSLYGQDFSTHLMDNAQKMLGKSYLIAPLDQDEHELLVTHQNGFDCVTFVESVLAITLEQFKWKDLSYEEIITLLRYRDGLMTDYSSRIHYFSEWLLQSECNDLGKNMSLVLGGSYKTLNLSVITSHLKNNPGKPSFRFYDKIAASERRLSTIKFPYIPKNSILKINSKLENGDLVAFSSSTEGLDIHHVGFIFIRNKKTYILHASSKSGKVEVSTLDLWEYIQSSSKTDGIVIFRFNNP